jgi:glutaredoxin
VKVRVYVADGCPHCAALLADLRRRGVLFEEVNLSRARDRIGEVAALSWDRRLPLLVDHERCSVGFAGGSSTLEELGL